MRSFITAAVYSLLAVFRGTSVKQEQQIKNLVTFGDSYTDIDIWYFDKQNSWPVHTAQYANVELYPFAGAGATCSEKIITRPKFDPIWPWPYLSEVQLPAYLANKSLKLDPKETIYTLWIGANDLGLDGLLTGSGKGRANASLVDVIECMVNWVKVLYNNGARYFLFQNMIPLQTVPMYAPGSVPNKYWNVSQPRNTTEWSIFMTELVLSGNALSKYMLEALIPTLPGANIGYFDSHALFADMYNNPWPRYLAYPPNVTGGVDTCIYLQDTDINCTRVLVEAGPQRDRYLWYDELHPSEQADKVVGKEIAAVIKGERSKWTTWLSGGI